METRLTGRDILLEAGSDDDDQALRPDRLPARPARRARARCIGADTELAHLQDHRPQERRSPASTTAAAPSSSRRWLTEGDSAMLHELAAEDGVSAERIRQIEAKAMQKMRGMLAAVA